eukprot:650177-Pelagomonas_calceolata.AAC.2
MPAAEVRHTALWQRHAPQMFHTPQAFCSASAFTLQYVSNHPCCAQTRIDTALPCTLTHSHPQSRTNTPCCAKATSHFSLHTLSHTHPINSPRGQVQEGKAGPRGHACCLLWAHCWVVALLRTCTGAAHRQLC